ncbi:hypothetical protein AA313_de0200501 [Arthrobotrys entomopaga]|nr:hypothetical protein AA313_de0200501 [Arthrobotrys entomopaga]
MLNDYDPSVYMGLPSVAEAGELYKSSSGADDLNDIGKIFFQHNMHNEYGIALLHRHFTLPDTERIVEYGGVATAWPIATPLPKGAEILPSNWSMMRGTPEPYEFEFVPLAQAKPKLEAFDDGFINDFHGILEERKLLSVFGLVRLPTESSALKPTFEATIGRASVTFPGDDMNIGVPAMWRFEDDGTGVCARVCSQCRDFGTC